MWSFVNDPFCTVSGGLKCPPILPLLGDVYQSFRNHQSTNRIPIGDRSPPTSQYTVFLLMFSIASQSINLIWWHSWLTELCSKHSWWMIPLQNDRLFSASFCYDENESVEKWQEDSHCAMTWFSKTYKFDFVRKYSFKKFQAVNEWLMTIYFHVSLELHAPF